MAPGSRKNSLRLAGLTDRLAISPDLATVQASGHVCKVVGLALESEGPPASVGDLVEVHSAQQPCAPRLAQVVGFRDGRFLLMPLDGTDGIRAGDRVLKRAGVLGLPLGPGLLGRVIDGLGRPIDGRGPITESYKVLRGDPVPESMTRPRIRRPFRTGVRAIDTILTCGFGQRVAIMAGSGVGKSTLLGMIARHSDADVNVIALIGERGKEVRDFVEDTLGEEGLRKSVVVVVTSDRPAVQRVKGAETAMAIAEFFRTEGSDVLVVMDSLTRYAMAQREIGLAAGEPPATRGYPPSVFGLLPRLLERAGTSPEGSITGFFTVLVEGDDMHDPVGDTVRGIVDGHIVLSRELATAGHYPPIDVLESVSRVSNTVCPPAQQALAQDVRETLAVYRRAADLIDIGAYKEGANPKVDRAVRLKPSLDSFLRQTMDDSTPWSESVAALEEIVAAAPSRRSGS